MSRKAKKKKHLDENGEKPPEDLLFYFDNVPTVIILGFHRKRIPWEGTTDCEGCHTLPGALHKVACPDECCPNCSGSLLQCPCDPDILNAEKDLFVECILNEQSELSSI